MKNPDTRVQFTRNALKQALLTLMEEKNGMREDMI